MKNQGRRSESLDQAQKSEGSRSNDDLEKRKLKQCMETISEFLFYLEYFFDSCTKI